MGRDNRRQQPGLGLQQRLVRLRREGPARDRRAGRSPIRSRRSSAAQGDLSTCRDSLWAALEQAGAELEAESSNPDPNVWRSNATAERIVFSPGHPAHHDALDQPAHVPAGDQLRRVTGRPAADLNRRRGRRRCGAPAGLYDRRVQE